MFTTFSGNTRRPRQVNLSGRRTQGFGSTGSGFGAQAALDRAQQERAQRQREREARLAAQTIQRVWRGHAVRRKVAQELRHRWDAAEETRLNDNISIDGNPYPSEDFALEQLRTLLRFANTRDAEDVERIRRYGERLIQTSTALSIEPRGPWPSAYLRLERLVLTVLDRKVAMARFTFGEDSVSDFMMILRFLADQSPPKSAPMTPIFYRTLSVLCTAAANLLVTTDTEAIALERITESLVETAVAPLRLTGKELDEDERDGYKLAYRTFGLQLLALPALGSGTSPFSRKTRDALADKTNYRLLAAALAGLFTETSVYSIAELATPVSRLYLLGAFIYMHRHAHNFGHVEGYSAHQDFVAVVSALLNSLPAGIVESSGFAIDAREDSESGVVKSEINQFLKEQLSSLVDQESIGSLLSAPASSLSGQRKAEDARHYANYALALLRFFPGKGDEIRMWLYMGPSLSQHSRKALPAIRYFWDAVKTSSVFGTIVQDSRAAIELLRPKSASPSSQGGNSLYQSPRQELNRAAVLADEWRVILVFLELYTFVLKVTDDEEFFSPATDPFGSDGIRESSLPLSEVKDLTIFLKNLGFTLYFNASDIANTEDTESSSVGLSFFNPAVTEEHIKKKSSEPRIGGVAGLSLDYIKGLVTGVLRMVYERDSRRKFLPSDHWLMTSHFDMTGFIPAVVEEEESRHKIEDEEAEDMESDDGDNDEEERHLIGTSRIRNQRRLAKLQRQQRKAARKRHLQAVAPRLEILQNMPFFIPFETRVKIFREFVKLDMIKRRGVDDPEMWRFRIMHRPDGHDSIEKHSARVRREHEFEDAYEAFYGLGAGLKEPIQITFVDKFGAVEAGIDGGGVTKEFLMSVTNRALQPWKSIDLFITNDKHLLYPNPAALEEWREIVKSRPGEDPIHERLQMKELLKRYEFIGRIIGKCMYEGILVDLSFAPFFLRKWALTGGTGSAARESGYRPTLNDMRELDEELYRGLHALKTYDGNVEDFALNFTVTDTIVVDHTSSPKKTKAITKELEPGGHNIPVTNKNRLYYISHMVRHRLSYQAFHQTSAFLHGLSTMINPSWLSMFNAPELQTLVGGSSAHIDIDDLRRHTQYGGLYVIGDDGVEHPTIQLFWAVMRSFSDDERRAVLKFVTSTPRAPLLGFGTLNPRFSIRDSGSEQERLPSTSTCVNLLKLPVYKEFGVLRERLLYAINAGAGFDLS